MKFVRWFLFPFSILYGTLMSLRNVLYDIGFKRTYFIKRPVIVVGNLSTGGTGKTPVVEYLIRLLQDRVKVVTLSRGYGRRTKGFLQVHEDHLVADIGDEPFQFYSKFGGQVDVLVGEDRTKAINAYLRGVEKNEVFLLDDAFQHRKIGRDMNILLTEYEKPFFNDFVLPTGNLRESRSSAKRADIIIVTKCPSKLDDTAKSNFIDSIRSYSYKSAIYFSHISYGSVRHAFGLKKDLEEDVCLISGIANPLPFETYMKEYHNVVDNFRFKDHYDFTQKDLDGVESSLKGKSVSLITTEKDMVRLLSLRSHNLFEKCSLFYVPIEIQVDDAENFNNSVIKLVESLNK